MRLVLIAAVLAAAAVPLTAGAQTRDLNPAISVNGLILGRAAEQSTDRAYNGIDLQEAEVRFTADVDPFWKANLTFAVHPEREHAHGHEEEGGEEHGGYTGDLEQAYVEGLAIPGGFGLVVGKDYLPFGKHVPLHTHQFPFVDAPVAVRTFLGDHSLAEVGARLAHTIPLPWYSDLAAYAVDGRSEIFDADSRDLAYGARWANLFDLSMESTLELSGSWLNGPLGPDYLLLHAEDPLTGKLNVWGADATFKWISASRSRGPALNLTAEVVIPRPDRGAGDPFGWYAVAQYRFARDWWLGAGAGGMKRDLPDEGGEADHADELFAWEEVLEAKLNLAWVPSEFSAVRLEAARYVDQVGSADEWLFSLQINFTIGSHPAHVY
jgi:hypothetical protein